MINHQLSILPPCYQSTFNFADTQPSAMTCSSIEWKKMVINNNKILNFADENPTALAYYIERMGMCKK